MVTFSTTSLVVLVNNHRRYVILLVSLLAFSTLLLLPWHAASLPHRFRGSTSLEEFISQEELRYSSVLIDRQAFIQQYGPNVDQVESFPQGAIYHTIWDFFIPAFNCPHHVDRIGRLGDGGKWVCGIDVVAEQRPPCVVYSFGVSYDSSYEAGLLTRAPHCEIWGYDFSVSSFAPEIHNNPVFTSKTHFFPYKVGPRDNHQLDPPEYTIAELMKKNGHDFIDVLKVDVETSEFEALEAFFKPYIGPYAPPLPFGQLEIEIHAWSDLGNFAFFYRWWTMLESAGLRPFWTEPNLPHVRISRPDVVEYSFINIRGHHAMVTSDW